MQSSVLEFLGLFIIGWFFYWSNLESGPLFVDDDAFIFNNPAFTHSGNPLSFWNNSGHSPRSWPLSFTLLKYIYQFAGAEYYWPYKLVNIILHILNSYLLVKIFREWGTRKQIFIAALIFLIHPMQVESISWIFQLKTLLATTFFLLSYYLYLYFLQKKIIFIYPVVVYLFFFSLVSKIVAVMLPFLFLFHALRTFSYKSWKPWVIVLPFFLLSFHVGNETVRGITYLHASEQKKEARFNKGLPINAQNYLQEQDFVKKSSNVFVVSKKIRAMGSFGFYIGHFIFPSKLSLIYGNSKTQGIPLYIFCGVGLLLVLATVIYFCFYQNEESKRYLYLLCFFSLSIFPVLGFFYIPYMKFSPVADHWNYLGIVPLSLLTVLSIGKSKFHLYILGLLICFWSFKTINYVPIFNHPQKVLERVIEFAPDEYRLYMQLGTDYIHANKFRLAQKVFERALKRVSLANNTTLLLQAGFVDRQLKEYGKLKDKIIKLTQIYLQRNDLQKSAILIQELKELTSSQQIIQPLEDSLYRLKIEMEAKVHRE